MAITYGTEHETLQPSDLSDADLLSIGRLVRAFAGIEEIVSIYVSILAQVPPKTLVLILGKVALRRRLDMAEALATLDGEDELKRFKVAFPLDFYQALDVRNAVAHGIFLGVDRLGHLSFLTEKTERPEDGETIQVVHGINSKSLSDLSLKTLSKRRCDSRGFAADIIASKISATSSAPPPEGSAPTHPKRKTEAPPQS